MALSKRERAIIYQKCGGNCAYCGNPLPEKGWHVDHIEPVVRKTKTVPMHFRHVITGEKLHYPEEWRRLKAMADEERENWERIEKHEVPDGFEYPERNIIGNLLPACMSCNVNKRDLDLEHFRRFIAGFVNSLNQNSVQYKLAKKYNLVKETGESVKFYFETLSPPKTEKGL